VGHIGVFYCFKLRLCGSFVKENIQCEVHKDGALASIDAAATYAKGFDGFLSYRESLCYVSAKQRLCGCHFGANSYLQGFLHVLILIFYFGWGISATLGRAIAMG
jgi:hypothetical protein